MMEWSPLTFTWSTSKNVYHDHLCGYRFSMKLINTKWVALIYVELAIIFSS